MKCSVEVYRGSTRISGIGAYSCCNREAIAEIDGVGYCWQHHPDKVRERAEEAHQMAEMKWGNKLKIRRLLSEQRASINK